MNPCQTTFTSRVTQSSCPMFMLRHRTGDNGGVTVPIAADDPLSARDLVLAATYRCVARFGLAKTTIDDVVKESGVSRASIYRQFPGGRDELLRETVGWEVANFFVRLSDQVREAADLVELLVLGARQAHHAVREHALLQTMLTTEPERLLGFLTTESAKTLPFIADFLHPYLEREQAAGRVRSDLDVARACDYMARMVLSFIGGAGRWDPDNPEMLEDLVRHEILGGILE